MNQIKHINKSTNRGLVRRQHHLTVLFAGAFLQIKHRLMTDKPQLLGANMQRVTGLQRPYSLQRRVKQLVGSCVDLSRNRKIYIRFRVSIEPKCHRSLADERVQAYQFICGGSKGTDVIAAEG